MNCCKKILIIKISALGDVIRTNGFIKAIKEKEPEVEIYFFTNVYYSEILKLSPYIKEVIKYPRHLFANVIFDNTKNFEEKYRIIYTFLKNIQKNNFDEIYDFTNTNESVFISTFLSNYQFEKIKGFYINKNFNLKTDSINWLHFNYFYEKGIFYPLTHNQFIKLFISDKIKESKGNYVIDEQIKYRVQKFLSDNNVNEKEKIYAIQIGAASSKRRWQKDELIKFLKYLNSINNNPLLFIGSDIEYNYIEDIIKSGEIKGLNLSNKFNLIEIATLISLSNFLFTMDTWAMHCASEFNTPFLVLEFNYTLFPIGSDDSYIYYKKEIYADEVIKIFETFFLKNNNFTKELSGTLFSYDNKIIYKYKPIINNLSEIEILNQIEGIIYLISFFETFKIQVDINFNDALYTIKKILKSNVNYNDFIECSITNINSDLENFINDLINNTFIDRIKNYRNKKYFFIDLFLLNNVLDENFYIPDVVQKQQNYLFKIIENYRKLKEQI